ncbi:hypothetical protein TrRE_jg3487 [Triparma retinervis]|uniref:Tryptophan synthase beta chain-like PALP domain-containing protein n=1 Tax=Triparma retinervis TaxID=2557542 RepID=A0A9W7F892_9STRA|nr:hypothetical protein TrRE_jg3487 [Triparma retinervis]
MNPPSSPPLSPGVIANSFSWGSQHPSYQVDFVAQNTGRRVALTKRRVRWRFGYPNAKALEDGKTGIEARGEEHEVSLVWSLTSGKKSVVFDNQEVHSSDSRASTFEFTWSRSNLHVYKIVAHATGTGPGGRQYDLLVDGQSYFNMPKVFELGLPNAGRGAAQGRQQAFAGNAQHNMQQVYGGQGQHRQVGGFGTGFNTEPIRAPRSPQEEERELQAAIRQSLAESESHLNRQKTKLHSEDLCAERGYIYVNGYDDPPIMAGAGTIGVEICDQVPDLDAVIVPVGGAGLIGGVSCAVKTLMPDCKVFGVEPEFSASYTAALAAGEPVETLIEPTLADGLAVPKVGSHAFQMARHYVDETFLTTEREIAIACLRLIENEKLVVEGGGAIGLTPILPGGPMDTPEWKGKNVVVPICGGNIDTTTLGRVIDRGLAADMRLVRFVATVSDRPGGIARLTSLLAEEEASVKDIYHERSWLQSSVSNVQMRCVLELRGPEHAKRVKDALDREGYPTKWDDIEDPLNSGDIKGTACLPVV